MTAPSAKATLAVMIAAGYIGLTVLSLVRWNEATSSMLILGFAMFAREFIAGYAQHNNGYTTPPPKPPEAPKP